MKNLVSIIVPVFNAERFIRETINSILQQSYINWELIIVDDCSKDGSVKIIKEYISDKIKLIELEENSGVANARNIGIKSSQGRFIAFLDADDLWLNDKLEKQIYFMESNNYCFTFTGYEFTDEKGITNNKKVNVPLSLNYNQSLKNTIISTITVMFDLKIISKEDILMPYVKSEDTATWWKILRKGYLAYGLNETLSYYRRSGSTLSSNKVEAIMKIWNLYRNVEKLSLIKSMKCFSFYAFNTLKKRI